MIHRVPAASVRRLKLAGSGVLYQYRALLYLYSLMLEFGMKLPGESPHAANRHVLNRRKRTCKICSDRHEQTYVRVCHVGGWYLLDKRMWGGEGGPAPSCYMIMANITILSIKAIRRVMKSSEKQSRADSGNNKPSAPPWLRGLAPSLNAICSLEQEYFLAK